MKNSDQLKLERTTKLEAQRDLVNKAKAENRDMNETETASFDAVQKEIENLDAQIERAVKFEANELRMAAAAATPVAGMSASGSEERELASLKKRYSIHNVIRSQMPNGKLDGIELELHQETVRQAEKAGVAISGVAVPMQSRADGQTVTQDGTNFGGKLVANELQDPIEFLRPKPILQSLGARFIDGLQGNLVFPTTDGGISGSWEGEVSTVAYTKNAYGSKTMAPKRYSASVLISLQNLMQTAGSLEAMTIQEIRDVIANAIDAAAINGTGTGQPLGILNTAGIGNVVGGTNGAAPTWSHIVDLETNVFVGNANAAQMAYLINPQTKGKLKQTVHAANASNYLMNADGTMNGYNVGVSNLVPANLTKGNQAGVCSAAIFGDFSQLLIGQWAFLDLSVDSVSKKRDGYVEVTANTFLDILVRQPKAFAAIKDLLTA